MTRGGPAPPSPEDLLTAEPEPVTSANVATRRLWLGLKYWNNEPVLKRVVPVSRPSRLVTLPLNRLERVARGLPSGSFQGLNLGEDAVRVDRPGGSRHMGGAGQEGRRRGSVPCVVKGWT